MINDRSEEDKEQIRQNIEQLKVSVESDPNPSALNNLGVYHSWLHEYEEAIKFYEQAEQGWNFSQSATDNKYRAFNSWAASLINKSLNSEPSNTLHENLEKAADLCSKAIQSTDPGILTAAHYNHGIVMYLQNDILSAQKAFEQSSDFCTDSQKQISILNNNGMAKSDLGFNNWAIEDLKSAADIAEGRDPDIYSNLVVLHARKMKESPDPSTELSFAQEYVARCLHLDSSHEAGLVNKIVIANIELPIIEDESPIKPLDEEINLRSETNELLDRLGDLPGDVRRELYQAEYWMRLSELETTKPEQVTDLLHLSATHYSNSGDLLLSQVLLPWLTIDDATKQDIQRNKTPRAYADFTQTLNRLKHQSRFRDLVYQRAIMAIIEHIHTLSNMEGNHKGRPLAHGATHKNTIVTDQNRFCILGTFLDESAPPGLLNLIRLMIDHRT